MLDYNDLTKRGQVRRLRRLVENALEQFDIQDYRLRFLKHLVNTTFVLTCERGRFLVRVHRVPDHTPERIASELAWLDALSREADVVVQTPMKTPDGRTIVMAGAAGVPEALPVTILTWVGGRIVPQKKRKVRDFRHLGQLAAKLHVHASQWEPPDQPDRRTYDAEGIFGPQAVSPLSRVSDRIVPPEAMRDLEKAYEWVATIDRNVKRTKESFGFIHFDLSFSNVLFTSREARPIDFDECGFGYYLGDLAVALAGPYGEQDFQERYEAVVAGYREFRPLPSESLIHLPAFLAARACVYILWCVVHGGHFPRGVWKSRLRLQMNEELFPVTWEV